MVVQRISQQRGDSRSIREILLGEKIGEVLGSTSKPKAKKDIGRRLNAQLIIDISPYLSASHA
jgi:hypothetical protein